MPAPCCCMMPFSKQVTSELALGVGDKEKEVLEPLIEPVGAPWFKVVDGAEPRHWTTPEVEIPLTPNPQDPDWTPPRVEAEGFGSWDAETLVAVVMTVPLAGKVALEFWPVPPFAVGSTPVTCVVKLIWVTAKTERRAPSTIVA